VPLVESGGAAGGLTPPWHVELPVQALVGAAIVAATFSSGGIVVEPGRPVAEMEDQPQLEARVRDRKPDAMLGSEVSGLGSRTATLRRSGLDWVFLRAIGRCSSESKCPT
jgi:hypothetical protein